MNKLKLVLVQHYFFKFLLLSLVESNQAAIIIQNPKLSQMEDGFLEVKPNGSIILRSALNSSTNIWQEAFILKSILNAIRLMPLQAKNTLNDLNQKIYGDGVEHKFPPFLERVIQRIQTYFSIYKYTDTSQPLREDLTSTSTSTTLKTTLPSTATTSGNVNETWTMNSVNVNEDNFNDDGGYYGFNRINKTTFNTDIYKRPPESSTPSMTSMADDAEEDEENEFIEIKNRKLFKNKKS